MKAIKIYINLKNSIKIYIDMWVHHLVQGKVF